MHNRIEEYRKTQGLTQTELAKMAGISRPFLSNIETGAAVPTVSVASEIAKVLKKTMDELFPQMEGTR